MQNRLKILLLEDDEDDYILTRDLLHDIYGGKHKLVWVKSLDEARELVEGAQHDVYIFDFNLGADTSLVLVKELNSGRRCPIPIIMLTGQEDRETDLSAMDAGATDYLVKDTITELVLERSIRYALKQKAAEAKVERLAHTDPLTGLPNRTLLIERLERAVVRYTRRGLVAGVLFIDLDHFKTINDVLGHSAGDELLVDVGQTLSKQVRDEDTVARFGGDEFVVLLADMSNDPEKAKRGTLEVANKILGSLSRQYNISGKDLRVTPSIGIALLSAGEGVDSVMMNADSAMYAAKEGGRNNYCFFEKGMSDAARRELQMRSDILMGLSKGQFEVHYQPLVQLSDGAVVGAEALVRWNHATLGLLSADKFITAAEQSGLAKQLGDWILRSVCSTLASHPEIPVVHVNVSAGQFLAPDFVESFKAVLDEYGISANRIRIDLTEAVIVSDAKKGRATVEQLNSLGVEFALDDFCTGDTSLSHLVELPVSAIKIDRTFVSRVLGDPQAAAIAKAVINLAGELGMQTVAEGVETEDERTFFAENGGDLAQGYLWSKAVPVDELMDFFSSSLKHAAG